MSDETYYSVLEIAETATPTEIKAAYHRLIREVHPDRLANAPAYWQQQAELKTKEINEAFSVLSKPAKRRTYDEQLDSYRKSQSPNSAKPTQPTDPPSSPSAWRPSNASSAANGNTGTTSRRQTGPTTTQYQNTTPKSANTKVSYPIDWKSRLFFASVCILFGGGATSGFWESGEGGDSWLAFWIAVAAFCCASYLYRHVISRLFARIGIRRRREQIWATGIVIVLGLVIGKVLSTKTNSPVPTATKANKVMNANSGVPAGAKDSDDFNYPSYVSIVQHVVGQAWKTAEVDPRTPYGSQVKVMFSISRGGTPSNVRIEHSSGYPSLDKSGLRAVRRVQNFGSLPSGYAKSSVAVEYTFTYNLGQQAKKDSSIPKKFPVSQITPAPDLSPGMKSSSPTTTTQYLKSIESEQPQSVLSQPSVPVTPATSKSHGYSLISADDQASIKAACASAYYLGPVSYHRCQRNQVAELAKEPNSPDLSGVNASDRNSIRAACASAYYLGPASYHHCLYGQLAELAKNPGSPNLSGINATDRGSILAACASAYYLGPASYHQCLWSQVRALATQSQP